MSHLTVVLANTIIVLLRAVLYTGYLFYLLPRLCELHFCVSLCPCLSRCAWTYAHARRICWIVSLPSSCFHVSAELRHPCPLALLEAVVIMTRLLGAAALHWAGGTGSWWQRWQPAFALMYGAPQISLSFHCAILQSWSPYSNKWFLVHLLTWGFLTLCCIGTCFWPVQSYTMLVNYWCKLVLHL